MSTDRWQTKRQNSHPPVIHVLPRNDLREHSASTLCWCKPACDREGAGFVVVHNSMDGRELVERHGLQ